MSEPGGPRQRGRHSSADDGSAGFPLGGWSPVPAPSNRYGVPEQGGRFTADDAPPRGYATGGFRVGDQPAGAFEATTRTPGTVASGRGWTTGGVSRVLDRFPEQTGPVTEPAWWAYGSSDHPDHPLGARHSEDRPRPEPRDPRPSGDLPGGIPREQYHPSAPLPPLPSGVWDRLRPRDLADEHGYGHADFDDDAATVAHRFRRPADDSADAVDARDDAVRFPEEDDRTDAHHVDPRAWEDRTGGLDVIGAHVENDGSRGRWWRRGRRTDRHDVPLDGHHEGDFDDELDLERHPAVHPFGGNAIDHEASRYHDDHVHDDLQDDDLHDDHLQDDDLRDDDIPIAPYDPRSARRRRRRSLAVLLSLLVLAGLVVGIVVGGGKLLALINPSSRDFTGQGTGSVEVRISQGDTLSDIARTLVDDGVIASVGPFVDAAEADPAATGIQPGVYRLHEQMSGKSAVDLLLDPAARLVSRVMLREGLTVKATLAKLAESTGTPVAEFEKAAANPAALGLPEYAGGKLEGFLFPATYDFEPGTTPAQMLTQMVERTVHAFDALKIPVADRLTVLTKASLVQAEAGSTEDMAKVARVLENRLADRMPLQLDTTVNYASGKSGITTSSRDRANPSPYNTYLHPGLPPGAIDNPGEEALRAVLSPAAGNWRFFVVVNPETGETRFAATGAEHQQNVLLFQQWLREHPGG